MRFVQSLLLLFLLAIAGHAQTSNLWRPQPNPTPPPCPQIRQFYNVSGSFQQIDCNGVITTISSGANLQDPGANGIVVRTAINTTVARTLAGTVNRIVVTDPDAVGGPPTFDVGSTVATSGANLSFFAATTSAQLAGVISDESGSGSLVFNSSPTIVTPTIASFANATHNHESAAAGGQLNASNVFSAGAVTLARGGTGSSLSDPGAHRLLGWDDTDNQVRFFVIGSGLSYDAGTDTLSVTVGGLNDPGANGIVARTALNTTVARTLQQPAAGFTISNANGVGGDPTFALANDLAAVEGLGSAGIAVRAAADTWAVRTLTGTTNRIVVTNGNGASDNPTFDIGSDVVTLGATQTLTNKTLTNPRIGTDVFDTNGNEMIRLSATGSAVNYVRVINNVTGQPPFITAFGDDTNVNLHITGQGTGRVVIPGYSYTLEVNTTTANSVGAGASSLHSFSLPAGSLANNGDYLQIWYSGTFAANDNDKNVNSFFDGQAVISGSAIDLDGAVGLGWTANIRIARLSATSVISNHTFTANQIAADSANAVNTFGSGGFTVSRTFTLTGVANLNSNAITILVQGLGSANNDVSQNLSIIELVQR